MKTLADQVKRSGSERLENEQKQKR